MNLDDKLRDVLKAWHQTGCPFSKDYGKCSNADCDNKKEPLIAQIQAAFAEAGYIKHDEYGVVQVYAHNATNVMTGQEWYDRFEAEMQPLIDTYKGRGDDPVYNARLQAMMAARRAAGLTEGSK